MRRTPQLLGKQVMNLVINATYDSPFLQCNRKKMLKFFADSVKETTKCNTQTKWKGVQLREVFAISSFSS